MQTRRSAHLAAAAAAQAASAAATESAHAVLFSEDLWAAELWRWLDVGSKVALRGVSRAMRRQVDGSVQVVASPACGFSATQLSHALAMWPGVKHLTLLGMSDERDLQPLATTAVAGLRSLTIREVGGMHGAHGCAWPRAHVAWAGAHSVLRACHSIIPRMQPSPSDASHPSHVAPAP
jgi:hypothetical protein